MNQIFINHWLIRFRKKNFINFFIKIMPITELEFMNTFRLVHGTNISGYILDNNSIYFINKNIQNIEEYDIILSFYDIGNNNILSLELGLKGLTKETKLLYDNNERLYYCYIDYSGWKFFKKNNRIFATTKGYIQRQNYYNSSNRMDSRCGRDRVYPRIIGEYYGF